MEFPRKIIKLSGTSYISVPVEYVKKLGLKRGDYMSVTLRGDEIIARKPKEFLEESNHMEVQKMKFMRAKDIRLYFGITDGILTDWRRNRSLPFCRIGDVLYFDVDKVKAWAEAHSVTT